MLADERQVDLTLLQKGSYPVMMEPLLTFLENQPGAFSCAAKRLRMPQFCPNGARVRNYQWQLVDKLFRRNGFVVSPCGSGKTLIGCLIGVVNGGRFLVLTTRYAQQWKETLEAFFTPSHSGVHIVVADGNAPCFKEGLPTVVIATYSAFCTSNDRYRILKQMVYDTILLDEMHTAAAKTHLSLIRGLHSVYACGLTATKVREDDELKHLESEFGRDAVHAEVDRQTLADAGFVANVRVVHLVVPHGTSNDLKALESTVGKVRLLGLHPHKIQVLYSAIKRLCAEKHKIIVFCDDLFGLDWIARIAAANRVPFVGEISMRTPADARVNILKRFTEEAAPKVIFMSRTGDEALDLPNASASIVFWNNWGSRRQIVQRIGRLARPSKELDPIFLVILLDQPSELQTSKRREDYLVAHGFKLISHPQAESPYGVKNLKDGAVYVKQLLKAWTDHQKKK